MTSPTTYTQEDLDSMTMTRLKSYRPKTLGMMQRLSARTELLLSYASICPICQIPFLRSLPDVRSAWTGGLSLTCSSQDCQGLMRVIRTDEEIRPLIHNRWRFRGGDGHGCLPDRLVFEGGTPLTDIAYQRRFEFTRLMALREDMILEEFTMKVLGHEFVSERLNQTRANNPLISDLSICWAAKDWAGFFGGAFHTLLPLSPTERDVFLYRDLWTRDLLDETDMTLAIFRNL